MAEPGRVGRFFVVMARFCASIASLKLGLDEVMVLLESPRPGRAGAATSSFFVELGLLASLTSSFCAWPSRFSMRLVVLVDDPKDSVGCRGLTVLHARAK